MFRSTFVEIHTLPPTTDSAMFHIYKAFFQVRQYMKDAEFEFTDWVWSVENGNWVPVRSSLSLRHKSFQLYTANVKQIAIQMLHMQKARLKRFIVCGEFHGSTFCNSSRHSQVKIKFNVKLTATNEFFVELVLWITWLYVLATTY